MLNAILGRKEEMSQTFVSGQRVPVTRVSAGPCLVTQVKRNEKDGYWAVQLGYGQKPLNKMTKPMQGHLRGVAKENKAPRFLREIRTELEPNLNVGDTVKVSDVFSVGDVISASSISKSKGFAGVVKRWGFAGGPKTHGQSDRQRAPGSIGQGTTPGRVLKGKHMAGRMGGGKVTLKNLHVIALDPEKNEILVSGPIPGIRGALIIVKKLSSGSLKDLEKETQTLVVEGESPEEVGAEVQTEQAAEGKEPQGGQEKQQEEEAPKEEK